jgi:tetratricopeptide (TPR) repeat protein
MNRKDRRRAAREERQNGSEPGVLSQSTRSSIADLIASATELHNRGQFAETMRLCRQILAIDRDNPEARLLLGSVASNMGDVAAARGHLERAISSRPQDPRPWVIISQNFLRTADYEPALGASERAIEIAPNFPPAHLTLGHALASQRKFDLAESAFRRALEINPAYFDAEANLGSCLFYLGRLDEALASHQRALAMSPEHPLALKNLAATLRALGRFDDALESYRRATSAAPLFAEAHRDEALLLLLLGRFDEGWSKYEWRWRASTLGAKPIDGKRWDGRPLAGRTILLFAEQGIGDALQMLRYVPLVAAKDGRVLLRMPPSLLRLAGAALDGAVLVSQDADPPPFDCQAPLMSLPGLFATATSSIPAAVPYIRPPKDSREQWRRRLAGDGRRVGIVWAGNPDHENDHNRSIAFAHLRPLLGNKAVQFYSLQVGPSSADLSQTETGIIDLSSRLEDFGETAAAIDALDLVITVDTAVAHLAGALGKPVWLLLPYVPDWRWLLERDDSPWYPTMRLFRQSRRGDWDEVIARVAQELSIHALSVE